MRMHISIYMIVSSCRIRMRVRMLALFGGRIRMRIRMVDGCVQMRTIETLRQGV